MKNSNSFRLAGLLIATAHTGLAKTDSIKGGDGSADPQLLRAIAATPLYFEPNSGSMDARVSYLARGNGFAAHLTPCEVVLSLATFGRPHSMGLAAGEKPWDRKSHAAVVRLKWLWANPEPAVTALGNPGATINELIGSDPNRWHANVRAFPQVKQQSVYPGVDVIYHGTQRQLEYDFAVAAGADPDNIQMQFEGVKAVGLDADGALLLQTAAGELRQPLPVAYQEIDGKRKAVECCYAVLNDRVVRFALGESDRSQTLVIDPVLSFLGLSVDCGGVVANRCGEAYLTGVTGSTDFPVRNAFDTLLNNAGAAGNLDAFVMRINTSVTGFVSLVYSTYIGGSGDDIPSSIIFDPSPSISGGSTCGDGAVFVTGMTDSPDFPIKNGFDTNLNAHGESGNSDAFIVRLKSDSAGNNITNQLVYSTYLGGSGNDSASGIAADRFTSPTNSKVTVVGVTDSSDFPLKNAFDSVRNFNGTGVAVDAFVTTLNMAGVGLTTNNASQLLYSTLLGGTSDDIAGGVAADTNGNVYVTGGTRSFDFPTRNAFDPFLNLAAESGSMDAFVAKLNPAGVGDSSLLYSTFLGGRADDAGTAIALDAAGSAYVAGATFSPDFPVRSGFNATINLNGNTNHMDAFVVRLNPAVFGDAGLVYSTLLGGSSDDTATAIAVDTNRNAVVAGITVSPDFPLQNAFDSTLNAANETTSFDAFVSKLATDASSSSSLVYSTFLGGRGNDSATGVALDPGGNIYVVGVTESPDFPTRLAFDQAINAGGEIGPLDGFLVRLNPALSGSAQLIYSTYVGGRGDETCFVGPVVLDFTPTNGPSGTSVVIIGTGFTGAVGVQFNGTDADFTVQSDNRIIATVPCDSTSGPIRVETPAGESTSAGSFNVTLPVLNMIFTDSVAAEPGTDTASFTVTRTGGNIDCPLDVKLGFLPSLPNQPGVAFVGIDFVQVPGAGTVTVPAGASSFTVVITALDDTNSEPTEVAAPFIISDPHYTLTQPGGPTNRIFILDDDPPIISLSVPAPSAAEPDIPGTFRIQRIGSLASPLTVNLALSGTAGNGVDYAALPTAFTLAAGLAETNIAIQPIDDVSDEDNETVVLTLLPGAGYSLGSFISGTVTIADDDPAPVVSILTTTTLERDISSTAASFPVRLSRPSGKTVRVTARTSNGSAGGCSTCGSGCDFINQTTLLTFTPGQTNIFFTVPVCGDLVFEKTETFLATLSNPSNATLSGASFQATGSILDNDGIFVRGSFDLSPTEATATPLGQLTYAFSWTVPEPENWHDLKALQFRLRDGDDIILSVLFDEASSTFSLVNEATSQVGPTFAAGSNNSVQTRAASLSLADTTVKGSGPTGPSVTLNLALSFKPQAAGRTFIVEVAASDDFGHQDPFIEAGTLTVGPLQVAKQFENQEGQTP